MRYQRRQAAFRHLEGSLCRYAGLVDVTDRRDGGERIPVEFGRGSAALRRFGRRDVESLHAHVPGARGPARAPPHLNLMAAESAAQGIGSDRTCAYEFETDNQH